MTDYFIFRSVFLFFLLITHQRDNESILCSWRNGMQGEEKRVVTGGGTDGFLWTHPNLSLKVQIVVPLIYQISVAKYCISKPWLVFKYLGLLPFHKLHSQVKISSTTWNRDFKWHGGFVTSWVFPVWGNFNGDIHVYPLLCLTSVNWLYLVTNS